MTRAPALPAKGNRYGYICVSRDKTNIDLLTLRLGSGSELPTRRGLYHKPSPGHAGSGKIVIDNLALEP